MAIENKFPSHNIPLVSNDFKNTYLGAIPTDRIIEYSLEEFKSETKVFAERQIASYQKKIDNLRALNHPEMKSEYIKRINRLILIERGEITE
ncbi:MAG: hypothetical protein V3V33_06505 [Candidatus Lokiarchaeia archaeon]